MEMQTKVNLSKQNTCLNISKKCIYVIANHEYFFALAVFVENLKKYCTDFDLFIADDGSITKEQRNIILNIYKKSRFESYFFEDFCNKFNVDKNSNVVKEFIKRFSHLTYLKIEIFNLLDIYDVVAFFDLDISITDNIDEIFDLKCDIAWRDAATLMSKMHSIIFENKININSISDKITKDTPAPNAGFIVVNKSFDYNKAYEMGKEYLRKFINIKGSMIDEIIFSLICVELNLKLLSLDPNIYNVPPFDAQLSSKIIHYIGYNNKPWSNIKIQGFFREWIITYLKISKKYGITSNIATISNNFGENIVKKYLYQQAWLNIVFDNNFYILINNLKISTNRREDKLIFECLPNLNYEIGYKVEDDSYSAGFRIEGRGAVSLKKIDENISEIITMCPCLRVWRSRETIQIFMENLKAQNVVIELIYLYKISKTLREFMAI